MELGQQKEQFSRAYVQAIAAVGGFTTYQHSVDEDSVDLGIGMRRSAFSRRVPRLEIQLKCTATADWHGDVLRFPLKAKNYEDLRGGDFVVPRLLVIVDVPDSQDEWLRHSDEELALRKAAYWYSLRDLGAVANTTSVTLNVPRRQRFTVDSLRDILEGISAGVAP